jgi:uroporphyrinogen decarboxylase
MTPRERIDAAVRGEKPDQTPVALWKHFPIADESAEGLAEAQMEFQNEYDFDLVKVTPASGYPAEAWGAKLINRENNEEGTREYLSKPIMHPEDWQKLTPLDVLLGVYGRELKALQLIRESVGPDIHVLQTIFSPLTIAKQLAGTVFLDHMRQYPQEFSKGMRVVSETTVRFSLECLKSGADGIFFASQFASHDVVSNDEYQEFGVEFDLPIFEAVQNISRLNLLHLHGTNPIFELLNIYPVDIVNWHDRETKPSLKEGQKLFTSGAVLGGLNRLQTFRHGLPDEVFDEVQDAKVQTDGRGVIIGAGCVTTIDTPDINIRAAIDAARAQ